MSDYKAPIRGIAKLILKLLTQLAQLFTNKIQDVEVRLMATGLLKSAEQTVEVLSDADPDDTDQLRKIVNGLLTTGEFKQGMKEELMQQIDKLSNEHVRIALQIINQNTFPIGDLLTDDNKDNSDQIRTHLIELLRSQDGIALFNSLLSIILPPTYANTLTVIIIQAIINWIEEDEAQETDEALIVSLKDTQKRYEQKIAA